MTPGVIIVDWMSKKTKSKMGKYRSRLSTAIHEIAAGLHRIGLMDKAAMREFDASCLTAVEPLSAREIAAIPNALASARARSRTTSM